MSDSALSPSSVSVEEDRSFLKSLPEKPGIYIFRNRAGDVLYVGKALRLRSRVRSYFAKRTGRGPWIQKMVEESSTLEHIVTANEIEALILESNYVKKHKPRHNVLLRDDKHFPYMKLSTSEDYPRLSIVRRPAGDGDSYLGPFPSASSLRRTIRFLQKTFHIRPCTGGLDDKTAKRCIYFQMSQCLGPCDDLQSKGAYRGCVDDALDFLKGKNKELVRRLKKQMQAHSEDLQYEAAAKVRDQIRGIEHVTERQTMLSVKGGDQDVLGCHREEGKATFRLFFIRGGRLLGDQGFHVAAGEGVPDGEVVSAFVKQYYAGKTFFPDEVLLPSTVGDAPLIGEWLSEKRGKKVSVFHPRRGNKRRLVEMASENASHAQEQETALLSKEQQTLEEIRQALGLEELPVRIEAFDVSNLQGSNIVGASVMFQDGRSLKDGYRRYKVRSVAESPDDYSSMREIVFRRMERLVNEGGEMPDLLLIDGGKGQLSSAASALEELGLADVALCAIAKGRSSENPEAQDVIFLPGQSDPVQLKEGSAPKLMLQKIRDEVHRFVLTFHRTRRRRTGIKSGLDDVPGLGPKRRRALLRTFGSLRGVLEASDPKLLDVEGITPKIVAALREKLGGEGAFTEEPVGSDSPGSEP